MTAKVENTAWYSYTSSTQTMKTWARVLHAYEDIPEVFRTAFPAYEGTFPYTVLIPEDRYSLFHKRNERILCMFDDRIVMLEASRNDLKTLVVPFRDVLYIEQGRVLLNSWLTIRTLSDTLSMRFNTTNLRCFTPVIESIRRGIADSSSQNHNAEQYERERNKFNYLNTLNYKYMNYGRQSIRPGDTVKMSVYQAPRCVRTITFLTRVLLKQYATSHLSILTDKEIILIKENARIKSGTKNLYGGVFSYIPLRHIEDLSLTPHMEGPKHQTLNIMVSGNMSRSSEYSEENVEIPAFYRACRAEIMDFTKAAEEGR